MGVKKTNTKKSFQHTDTSVKKMIKIRPTQKTLGQQPLHFHIVSLFPEAFKSYITSSILARAISEQAITIDFYNPRNEVKPKGAQKLKEKPLRVVDDRPYGGGPGMVMKAEPVIAAIDKAYKKIHKRRAERFPNESVSDLIKEIQNLQDHVCIVFLSPGGEQFTTETAKTYAKQYKDIIFVCGRYEGIDARVKEVFTMTDISVGPWVTTGGELPALIMIDSIARQVQGVLGNFDSREEERVSSHDVYTRPESFVRGSLSYKVPEVLVSGDHKKIDAWREKGTPKENGK
jgi:tRNA (guanine37-N1)-methyltransferase